jgi:hypothetical protein
MEIKIMPLLFAKSLGICELEAEGTLSRYKTDVAPLNSIMWKPIRRVSVVLTEYSN